MHRGRALLDGIDNWQQRRRAPAFVVAVFVRFREDRGRDYGALLSYYGFMSLFPLLLVLVTVLGLVLDGNDDLRNRILDTVYEKIPVLGSQLRENATSLDSNGAVLLVGLVVSLWSGLAVVKHAQSTFNLQWGVPRFQHPGLLARTWRSCAALAVLGFGILVATAATTLAAHLPDLPGGGRVVASIAAIVVNVVVLTVSFRVLVRSKVAWRDLVIGGVAGGVALWGLQLLGGTYVNHVILNASDVYGVFAVMFGLLVWIALLARTTLLANEVNVVRAKHLWPRSLGRRQSTDADRRALEETMWRESSGAGIRIEIRDDGTDVQDAADSV